MAYSVVGQFELISRRSETKSELGAQRPAKDATLIGSFLKPAFFLYVSALECRAGRCAPSSDFVLAIRAAVLQSSRTGAKF